MRNSDEIRRDLDSMEVRIIKEAGANMAPNRLVADVPCLLAEVSRFKAERDAAREKWMKALDMFDAARDERDVLRAAVDRVRALCDEWVESSPESVFARFAVPPVLAALAVGVPEPTPADDYAWRPGEFEKIIADCEECRDFYSGGVSFKHDLELGCAPTCPCSHDHRAAVPTEPAGETK